MRKTITLLSMIWLVVSLPIAVAEELSLTYDLNGNLVTGDGFYREYNSLNQLSVVREGNSSSGAVLQEYTWHPVEERILVKRVYESGNLKEKIVYVNDNFVQVINSSGVWNETYVKQDGVLVAQVAAEGDKQAIHHDHLGSVDTITDATGAVIQNNFFSAFGEPIKEDNSRFGYEGMEHDKVTGLTDFNFRMYKSEWGRFQQPDTLIPKVYDPQTLNRYSFEYNNPMNVVDPSGHIGIFGVIFVLGTVALVKNTYEYTQKQRSGTATRADTISIGVDYGVTVATIGLSPAADAAITLGDEAFNVNEFFTYHIDNAIDIFVKKESVGDESEKLICEFNYCPNIDSRDTTGKPQDTGSDSSTQADAKISPTNPSVDANRQLAPSRAALQQAAIQRARDSGGGYVSGVGYVTKEGRTYPTSNPNFRPSEDGKGGNGNGGSSSGGNKFNGGCRASGTGSCNGN